MAWGRRRRPSVVSSRYGKRMRRASSPVDVDGGGDGGGFMFISTPRIVSCGEGFRRSGIGVRRVVCVVVLFLCVVCACAGGGGFESRGQGGVEVGGSVEGDPPVSLFLRRVFV